MQGHFTSSNSAAAHSNCENNDDEHQGTSIINSLMPQNKAYGDQGTTYEYLSGLGARSLIVHVPGPIKLQGLGMSFPLLEDLSGHQAFLNAAKPGGDQFVWATISRTDADIDGEGRIEMGF
jgi:hypothetical protein